MTSDNQQRPPRPMSRRTLLYGGAATVAAVAGGRLLGSRLDAPAPTTVRPAAAVVPPVTEVHFAATDGWVSMPAGARQNPPFWPDSLAPSPFDLYVFGFRDVTGLDDATVKAQRGKAQISAPLLAFDQGTDIKLTLTNLGLSQRPDLVDGHTVHWHGFQNAIPLFDGVPELSISVPIGRDFTYFYRPREAGTYMYHCHFEDVEHVQMGMTGVVFVRPAQNRAPVGGDPLGTKYAYNDGDGSTRYQREFAFMLTEIWAEAHYRDAHIQTTDWTDFSPSFWTMNGRCYPDTLVPNGNPMSAAAGRLQYQPNSSLITANEGDRVLLRLANLGYQNHSLTADGITLTTVAKDAAPLVGRDGTQHYLTGNSVEIGPGESRDVLFTAPAPGTYLLYDRDYGYLNNGGGGGYGGQLTEIRVSPAGTLGPQTTPNT
ncbi:multicopper oxidase domain-containing protein [Amycolatopsis sp. NBC_01488]|uniref:multicopper oxidase domain-containing protein n=1 Tax=Amycolatopsis sp. NBC_01488 TaxID=2903563 RepID=UPI002E28287C|nr:multicopper oxidase domain-containing protein [Amycolatopsis sp. NBC_01488]